MIMKFNELSFMTRFKLIASNILVLVGLYVMFTSTNPLPGLAVIFAGNLLNLDGRISRIEENNESNRK